MNKQTTNKRHERKITASRLRRFIAAAAEDIAAKFFSVSVAHVKFAHYLCSAKLNDVCHRRWASVIGSDIFRAFFVPIHKQLRLSYPDITTLCGGDILLSLATGYDSRFPVYKLSINNR